MKKEVFSKFSLVLVVFSLLVKNAFATDLKLIPYPSYILANQGYLSLDPSILCYNEVSQAKENKSTVEQLFPCAIKYTHHASLATLRILKDSKLDEEAYRLIVSESGIDIYAQEERGLYYALQTLNLLRRQEVSSDKTIQIPFTTIEDSPRFHYRGLMLDVARYFIPKEEILRLIDIISLLKINKLHLHLVDDNGWRLEIKKHPKLTEIGAWRVYREEKFPARANPLPHEATPVGGYYTQEDIREIIKHASRNKIEVIPEIEMPAHTISSLAAYPELACPVVDQFIGVLPGIGGPQARVIYCAGNEQVFQFLADVLDEVTALFPSKYIHLGGDEADKYYWKRCPKCQKRMKEQNLQQVEELQGYFMNRVSKYVQAKGKQVIGWDELTNSELPQESIIMGWQGKGNAALKAAKEGHQFIMTPAQVLYLIRYQGPQWFEPFTYFGNNTLKDIYTYEPIQKEWDPEFEKLLLGVQASMWTEFCDNNEDLEYQLFPRLLAFSEIAWSGKHNKDWKSFLSRMDNFLPILNAKNITYAKSMYNINHKVEPYSGSLKVTLSTIRPDLNIHYTTDGSVPTIHSPRYHLPIRIAQDTQIQAATFKQGEQLGQVLSLDLNYNLATGCAVQADNPAKYVLTNGLRGSSRHSDFEWAGWYNKDDSFVIDLGQKTKINQVVLGSITNYSMCVHKPKEIQLSIADDSGHFTPIKTITFTQEQIFNNTIQKEDISFDQLNTHTRYIKVEFKNPGVCPIGNPRAGAPNWIYFDEIIVL